jgi:hypothetical protein
MVRTRREAPVSPTEFSTESSFELNGFIISAGDTVKVEGEYGSRFKVCGLTTNAKTGSQWVDCFEINRGQIGALRSFKSDRIKRIPQKGKRAKRVND